jgi:tRNA(fMet)-specific endonuclease VapC
VTTVVSIEEQYSGRLAQVRKANSTAALVEAYEKLKRASIFLADLSALDYTAGADQLFREFRSVGIRIGTQDLRIAAIVLAHDGILATRNLRDFEKVPGLRIQDWSL